MEGKIIGIVCYPNEFRENELYRGVQGSVHSLQALLAWFDGSNSLIGGIFWTASWVM